MFENKNKAIWKITTVRLSKLSCNTITYFTKFKHTMREREKVNIVNKLSISIFSSMLLMSLPMADTSSSLIVYHHNVCCFWSWLISLVYLPISSVLFSKFQFQLFQSILFNTYSSLDSISQTPGWPVPQAINTNQAYC